MDNMLDKFGIYDFFGILLPGMYFLIIIFLDDLQLRNYFTYPDSEVFKVVAFILLSYISGTIMQEMGSFFDDKITKIRKSARRNYLYNKGFSETERRKIKKIVNKLNKKSESHNPIEDECQDAFFICKAHLENKEKIGKAEKLNSIFAMSREFIVCNVLLFICVSINTLITKVTNERHGLILLFLLLSSFLYFRRAKRYSAIRVRNILRQYIDLCDL